VLCMSAPFQTTRVCMVTTASVNSCSFRRRRARPRRIWERRQ
jgi:hypothetical protein